MLSKAKFNFIRKFFSSNSASSLKQKKENLIKNKNFEKIFEQHKTKITEEEIDAVMSKFNFRKIIAKLGLVFLIPPAIYFLYKEFYLPKNSKALTDIYNSSINFIVMGNSLFLGAFIGFNYKSVVRAKSITMAMILFYISILQTYMLDRMEILHIIPLFITNVGILTMEVVLGQETIPAWYKNMRFSLLVVSLMIIYGLFYRELSKAHKIDVGNKKLREYKHQSETKTISESSIIKNNYI